MNFNLKKKKTACHTGWWHFSFLSRFAIEFSTNWHFGRPKVPRPDQRLTTEHPRVVALVHDHVHAQVITRFFCQEEKE